MLTRYYAPWELRNMIFAVVKNAGSKGLTRAEICRQIGRSKGKHITDAIEAMVGEGVLSKIDLKRSSQAYFLYVAKKRSYKADPDDFLVR